MTSSEPMDQILASLRERAKELSCLYAVDEILSRHDASEDEVFRELVRAIPPGWQFPDVCRARLVVDERVYESEPVPPTSWRQTEPILRDGEQLGELAVYYTEFRPAADEGPFLKEERKLLRSIADHLRHFLAQRDLRSAHARLTDALDSIAADDRGEWRVILEFLRRTDTALLARITRKMINRLCALGDTDAEGLLQEVVAVGPVGPATATDENRPLQKADLRDLTDLAIRTFDIAARHLSTPQIISRIQAWIETEKTKLLNTVLENPQSGLMEIGEALERYVASNVQESELPLAVRRGLHVALLRRFFTEQIPFVNVAKSHVRVADFHEVLRHTIFPARSHGRLGGKSSGLFLASRILRSAAGHVPSLAGIRTPRTWYLSSDALLAFTHHNNLEDLYNQRYRPIERVRQEYPHVVQVFKNSSFPPELQKGLAVALDDFEDRPIIVRSSSLLEDRSGASFAGKYKSLFLANQGSKRDRLAALEDAIAEVYASVFGPDPVAYRAERGLLDVHEEMGIMIQEVVGRRVGRWFYPAFSGVAFSHNEFRWSPRIRREDGLLRMVPGLGTRAVDRTTDDYPVLVAPGQPGLRVNVTADEIVRYAPNMMDVIDLERNAFVSVPVEDLVREAGEEFPCARRVFSMVDGDRVRRPVGLEPDWDADELVCTFEGILEETPFVTEIADLLRVLRERIGEPVDLEFAHDGEHLHLLQCRVQSYGADEAPAPIPRDLPEDRIVFSAHHHVSNGRVPDVTHVVYVDPDAYARLETVEAMTSVGRVVGRLNKVLPKRQFVLIGPGRWGSRGDIRLGVSVTYADISNTAMLLEVARRKGGYVPELSFGTHFFQDLVEAGIRYLPLYPDEPGSRFDERFLLRARNILPEILPERADLAETVRVIDVRREADGRILRVLMNADLDEAVGILAEPSPPGAPRSTPGPDLPVRDEEHWRWRFRMAERIGRHLDPERFGVKGLYVFGSAKNATAGPASDLDLIVHVTGTAEQRCALQAWLEGWSRALAEVNYLRTGYASDGLLDVHPVTDEDIENRTSFASKIDAVTDAARPLPLGGAEAG